MSTKKNIPLTEEERVDQYGSFYSLYGRLNFEDADQMRSTKPIAFRDKQGQTSKLQDNWSIVFDDLLFSARIVASDTPSFLLHWLGKTLICPSKPTAEEISNCNVFANEFWNRSITRRFQPQLWVDAIDKAQETGNEQDALRMIEPFGEKMWTRITRTQTCLDSGDKATPWDSSLQRVRYNMEEKKTDTKNESWCQLASLCNQQIKKYLKQVEKCQDSKCVKDLDVLYSNCLQNTFPLLALSRLHLSTKNGSWEWLKKNTKENVERQKQIEHFQEFVIDKGTDVFNREFEIWSIEKNKEELKRVSAMEKEDLKKNENKNVVTTTTPTTTTTKK